MPKNAKIIKVLVLFHTEYRSARLTYVLDYIFVERLGVSYAYEHEAKGVESKIAIHYTANKEESGIHIKPQGFLNKTGKDAIDDVNPFFIDPAIASSEPNTFPDLFSAVFFHLSRYEEYHSQRDEHGRFDYRHSALFQNKLIEKPIVDLWIIAFKKLLVKTYQLQNTDFKIDRFQVHAGIDIDSVFAYKGKNTIRQIAAFSKAFLQGHWTEIKYRTAVLLGKKKDPNDNFDYQLEVLKSIDTTYFVQVGPHGVYDKNVSPSNTAFKDVIRKLKEHKKQIALHPSYQSNSRTEAILKEKKILEDMSGSAVSTSRQHFLKFTLPETYRNLIACGIHRECSMGYSEIPGFRAGTAFPFYWYDLEAEKATTLQIQPFSVMDVAYKQFLKYDSEKTCLESAKIKDLCKQINAPFHFVFHNESLSEHRGWETWRDVFNFWSNG